MAEFTAEERDLLIKMVEEGLDILKSIQEAKVEDAKVGVEDGPHYTDGDIGGLFEEYLKLIGEEAFEAVKLEQILKKLKGGENDGTNG